MGNSIKPRDVFARALMSTATEANDLDGHMLIGFAVIAEWLAPDGERYLTMTGGSGEGRTIPEWTVQGYLTNALGGMADWTCGDGDSDDDTEKD